MTSNNAFRARRCIMGVVVPEAGNLNDSNANMCSDVAGPQPPGRLTLDLALDPVLLLFPPLIALLAAILDLSVTSTPILHFRACYVIMHKVRSITWRLRKARENMRERATIGFGFNSDWLWKLHEVLEPIATRSNLKPKQMRITFDTTKNRSIHMPLSTKAFSMKAKSSVLPRFTNRLTIVNRGN